MGVCCSPPGLPPAHPRPGTPRPQDRSLCSKQVGCRHSPKKFVCSCAKVIYLQVHRGRGDPGCPRDRRLHFQVSTINGPKRKTQLLPTSLLVLTVTKVHSLRGICPHSRGTTSERVTCRTAGSEQGSEKLKMSWKILFSNRNVCLSVYLFYTLFWDQSVHEIWLCPGRFFPIFPIFLSPDSEVATQLPRP